MKIDIGRINHIMRLLNEYEQELIIMLLASERDMQKTLLSVLSQKMFLNRTFAKVFEICEHLMNSNKEVNVFTVTDLMKNPKEIETVLFLQSNYITNVNYKFYVNKVHEAYFSRLIENARTPQDMNFIQKEMDNFIDTTQLLPVSYQALDLLNKDENQKIIKTGYPSIDEKLGCMQGGDFIILAGATSMGKTCMMLNLIASIANQGYKVDVFSLEMSMKQLQNRLICSQTGVNASRFRTQSFRSYELDVYKRYIDEKLPLLPIKICTEYNITVQKIRDMVKKSDSDIVFIDYLGLISGNNHKTSYERIGEISRELKLAAMEVNKPFFVLHQLNRNYADRQDKTPKLSDLRDSGKIEQDADMVCFVHRPYYYEPDRYKIWDLQFLIGKSRHTDSNQRIDLLYDAMAQTVKEKKYL